MAVIDAIALQQVVPPDPTKPAKNEIVLSATALPYEITIDPKGIYAYVTDELLPLIYVIDIRPSSPTYNQCIKTIDVNTAIADLAVAVAIAPFGLRGLAVNTDGTKLYVAAPNVLWQGLTPALPVGHILVIDLTPKANGTPKWTPLPPINAGQYPYGVTAGPNDSITFTDFLFKNQSLGLIQPGSNTATFGPLSSRAT